MIGEDVFAARLDDRRRRTRAAEGNPQWLWVSRVEPLKGTEILKIIASLRPQYDFHIYGPLQHSLEGASLISDNITYRGILTDISAAIFSNYIGFVFTSLFEGMPNIVLEMTQHAIPMVLADVGGLRDTFAKGALFVEHQANAHETAIKFAETLDQVVEMDVMEAAMMSDRAAQEAKSKHAPEHYAKTVSELFNL